MLQRVRRAFADVKTAPVETGAGNQKKLLMKLRAGRIKKPDDFLFFKPSTICMLAGDFNSVVVVNGQQNGFDASLLIQAASMFI